MVSRKLLVLSLACLLLAACGASLANPRQLPIYVPRADRMFDATWLELHVKRDGRVWYGDRMIFDPATEDPDVLRRALVELRRSALHQGHIIEHPSADNPLDQRILAPVLIRSHKHAEWVHTHLLMVLFATPQLSCQTLRLALLEA
ncbi:MAG: hypothetical protein ACI8UD_002400 [Planctomycetota bacterium]